MKTSLALSIAGFLVVMATWGVQGSPFWAIPAAIWAICALLDIWMLVPKRDLQKLMNFGCGECQQEFATPRELFEHMFTVGHCLDREMVENPPPPEVVEEMIRRFEEIAAKGGPK